MKRSVRSVCADVREKGIVVSDARLNEAFGFLEVNIRTIAFVFLRLAVVPISIVELRVVPVVRRLAYAPASMANHFRKATIFRSVRIIVAQVPFAEHSRLVSIIQERLTQSHFANP